MQDLELDMRAAAIAALWYVWGSAESLNLISLTLQIARRKAGLQLY